MHLLVIIPALNEANAIESVISTIPAMTDWDQISILVIDDGSSDDTGTRARTSGAEVMRHDSPRGIAQVFREAVRLALERDADALVMIDGDGQFNSTDIPRLLEPIVSGDSDFVAADRFSGMDSPPPDMPAAKYVGNHMMNRLIRWLTGTEVTDVSSGFRAYSREALLHLNIHSSFTYTQEVFLDLATKRLRIRQVPVEVRYDPERRSRVVRGILRYAIRSASTILRAVRDNRPFFVFGLPAAVLCFSGIGLGVVPIVHFASEGSFSPYIFMALSGAYLFTLGIILAVVALASDMLRPIRRNQEMLLYLSKLSLYGSGSANEANVSTSDISRHTRDGS